MLIRSFSNDRGKFVYDADGVDETLKEFQSGELLIEDLDKLRHALGMTESKKSWGYRNHFCAGSADEDSWNRLVVRGFALECNPNSIVPYRTFKATALGARAVGLGKVGMAKAGLL